MMKMRTALVRNEMGNVEVKRYDDYESNKEFAEELRGNGYKVLKVWAKFVSFNDADEWYFLNRNK